MRKNRFLNRKNIEKETENMENTAVATTKRRGALKTRLAAFCVLLALSFAAAIFGFTGVFAPIRTVENEQENTAYAAVADDWVTAVTSNGTFKLTANWTATANSANGFGTNTTAFLGGALYVNGKTVTIDLNGYTLNRNNTSARANGAVIVVANGGKLTIKDSMGGGVIRGGFNKTASATVGSGGAISVNGSTSTLTIEGGTITANKSSVTSTGTAIHVYNGATLTMTGGTVSSNANSANATYSGALYLGGGAKANVSNVTFSGNSAPYQNCAGAVVVQSNSGAVNFTNCTFTGNSVANSYGAGAIGIFASSNVTFTGCTIQSNSTSSTYGAGGLLAYGGSNVKLTNCTVNNNTSSNSYGGGGIHVNASTVTLVGGTISGNKCTYSSNYTAGGILVYNGSTVTTSADITGNSSVGARSAGGICLAVSNSSTVCRVYMTGGSVSNNTATGANTGGGVSIQTASHFFQLTGGTISGNKGVAAGGIFAYTGGIINIGGAPKVESNTLSTGATNNVAFLQTTQFMTVVSALTTGAHIGVTKLGNNYNLSLSQITSGYNAKNGTADPANFFFADQSPNYSISRWSASGEAMIFCHINSKNWDDACLASTATLQQTVKLYSNWTAATFGTTASYYNGALQVTSAQNVKLDLNGFSITRNKGASTYGYVIYQRGILEIIDSVGGGQIKGGNNTSNNGGGIYFAGTTLTIRGGTITGNGGSTLGGGVFLNSGVFNFYGGTISGNTATDRGGGVYMKSGTFNMYGGTISGNSTKEGGGVFMLAGAFNMYGGTITGNSGSTNGGGVFVTANIPISMGGSATVYNNKKGSANSNIYLAATTAQTITITSKMTATTKTGVTRSLIGLLTTGWVSKNPGVEPDTMFESDTTDKYVMAYSTGEAAFLSMNNDENWTSAVKNSVAEKNTHKVRLTKNWSGTLGSDSTAYWSGGLYVPSGASIILDLNGFTIDRALTSALSGGCVIRVEGGSLEIIDSSAAKTGTLKGGYNSYSSSNSVLRRGGGIIIYNGTVIMRAGTITGCRVTTASGGGGVQLMGGSFTMYGGAITGNTNTNANAGAGGVFVQSGTFNFYGGTISGNSMPYYATTAAAGVCIQKDAVFNVKGDVKIQGNNFTDGTGADCTTIDQAAKINIVGALSDAARIGFRREVNNYTLPAGSVFTSNYSKYNSGVDPTKHFFASEHLRHRVETGKTEGALWCIDNAKNWSNCYAAGSGTVKLYSDWNAVGGSMSTLSGFSSGRLYCYGKTMTLDLNGYTINRGLTGATANGQVIYLRSGSLTIIDSSAAKTGKITGGYGNDAYGGGIYAAAGTLNLYGGEITGNRTNVAGAGGVYLANGVTVNLGNSISVHDNLAANKASNLYCVNISQMFNVAAPLTSSKKLGIYRDKNGEFTTNFKTQMSGKKAADYFSCDMDIFFVLNSAANEGSLLTTDNSANWEDAVLASVAASGAWQQVVVCKDWFPTSGSSYGTNTTAFFNGAMYVPAGASIILDLNGFTVNRKLTSSVQYGFVFYVRGKLRIIDSSSSKAGTITGGYNNTNGSLNEYAGGAIGIRSGATVTIEGGTIKGNRSVGVGAIGAISGYGTLVMSGGTITGNTGVLAGGVYMSAQAFTASGSAKIEGNTISTGAASNLYYATQTHVILVGGAFTDAAHIGISRTGNIDNYSSDNLFTSGYKRYNTAKANTKFFSDSANYIVDETSAEAKLFCVNNAINWTNAVAKNTNVTVKLYSDWNAGYDASYTTTFYEAVAPSTSYFRNGALYLPKSRSVILDLNGFTLNRNLKKAVSNGYAIYTEGNLEIKDTSSAGTGKVTGAYSSDGAGGVMVAGAGVLKIASGTISGNIGKTGAGVYVDTGANIYIGGTARIENNKNLSNVASNIYLTGATQVVNIMSRLESGRVFGLTRAANGEATKGWATYCKRLSPEDFFVSEHINYGTMTAASGELAFLSSFIDLNWQSAVETSLNTKTTQTVKLNGDWIPESGNFGTGTGYYGGMLYVPAGASIVLDMNGFNINRNLKSAINYGGIFRINGELTIINRKGTGSIITGGKTTYQSNGRAGGAYIAAGGMLSMTGAIIQGNTETGGSGAGGVYVAQGASFTIKDGGVVGNTGVNNGGVLLEKGARFQVGGAAVTKDNVTSSGLKRDVQFIYNMDKIYVNAALTSGADVRVYKAVNNYLHDGHDVITVNYSRYNSEPADTYFHASDDPAHIVVKSGSECALFCHDNKSNWVNAIVASANKQETFILYDNWTATNGSFGSGTGFYSSTSLRVPTNRNLIIDLNGYTIDRGLKAATQYGFVMYLQSRVYIIDSSTAKTGKITGGYSDSSTNPAGIWVERSTTTITGGIITGNRGGYGAWVNSGAYLELGGTAQILGNTNGSANADIMLVNNTNTVNIVSKLAEEAKFGISRAANGVFTKNYGVYNSGDLPENHFTSQNSQYYVTDNGLEGASLEGFFLSTDPKINWQFAVQQSINNGGRTQTFKLLTDWDAVNGSFGSGTGFRSSSGLYVPSNASIILDLNGHTINKGKSTATTARSILFVDGTLEIIDSSGNDSGTIRGGIWRYNSYNNYDRSGGITVRYGKVTMRGGTITDNTATGSLTSGGAVYIHSGATFEMLGGNITGNTGYKTGGIFVVKNGKLNLGGAAKIYNNPSLTSSGTTAGYNADVYFQNTDAGYATIVAPFEYNDDGTAKAKIGVLADAKKIIASGTVITSGWYKYNPDHDPESVFYSDEATEYRVGSAVSNGGKEAVLYCLNNSINWATAVSMSLSQKNTQTFRLYSDWTPDVTGSYLKMFGSGTGYRYGALRVPKGASIILDLNGFDIDRQMPSGQKYGYVIFVEGTLKIIDSTVSESGAITQGKITGGWCSGNGNKNAGAIYVESSAILTITGGTITGNKTQTGGGITVSASSATINMGGTAQIYKNVDLNGNSADLHLWGKDTVINVIEPMRFDSGEAGKIGVMRGTIDSKGKPTGLGQLTSGWGKNVPGEDPVDHFFANTDFAQYIVVSSLDFDEKCEAVILSNDNLDNWVFAVTTSLNKKMTTRFTLSSNWTASAYTKYSYYKTSFGQVANCFQNGGLLVPEGASIVMDLNGKSINRDHPASLDTQYAAFNYVILVKGSLQIVDSSTGKTGTITGGSYGIQIAENGFVCIGALPEDSEYMKGNGSQYVVRDEERGSGSITGNTVYGVYSTAGTLAMTGGRITGNPVGAFMGANSGGKDSTVMLGGSAYIYTDDAKAKDLVLNSLFTDIDIISPFKSGAKVGFYRDAIGQVTSGWGKMNGNDSDPLPYFVSKGSEKYNVETTSVDGSLEVFLTSYDNLLNWQYAVAMSLATGGKQQVFTMYSCWIADPDATYVTSFGNTSAFTNGALYVPYGANILMNMNGHKLDRALSGTGASSGYVVYVDGTLEIIDTQIPNPTGVTLPNCYRDGGLITGGYNKSGSSAGAIHIGRGILTLNDVTIKDNKADSTSATAGAIYVGGTFNFNSGTITKNEGYNAGAVYVSATGKFTMPASEKAAVISENYASGAGGGAVYAAGVFNMEGGTIRKNSSMAGGVFVANGGKFTLRNDAAITENEGSGAGGVYVYNSSSSYFNMEGGFITNNEGISAGGIYVTGTVNMTGGEISGNKAKGSPNTSTDSGGGGMYLASSAVVTITGGRIVGNTGLNGVRVYSSGTINLGGSAYIAENITTDADLIAAEGGGPVVYSDVYLTAETRKINIISKFDGAHVGIYRIGAGIVTKNYGKFNEEHPNNYFFSNKSIYAIAMTAPEEDTFAEAVVGTPIDAPVAYLVDEKNPVYSGQWQTIITGYDDEKMLCEKLPANVRGINKDADGNVIIEAVDAGTYVIAFTLAPSYCWKDGSTAPKQIHAVIMPYTVSIVWENEKHTNAEGVEEDCRYDGVTVHVPKASIAASSLFTNALSGEKDECTVDVDGATIFASGDEGHTAVAVMLSNPNYQIDEASSTYTFYVSRAELPDFKITTTQAEFKTPCTIKVSGNLENGKLHYSLPDNPANVTIDAETGELFSAEKDLTKRIKVKVEVEATANYNACEAVGEIQVLPGKVHTEFEQTEITYGDTVQLTLKDYDPNEMGAITFTFSNVTGIGNVTADGQFTTRRVGEVEVTATIAARDPYAETVIEGTITIVPRTITVNWDELSSTYDGSEHSPVVSIASGVIDADINGVTLSTVSKGTANPAVFTNAGQYDISVVISSSNYKLAADEDYHNVYEILKAEITPVFKDTTAYYDTAFTPEIDGNSGNGSVSFAAAAADADKVKVEGNSFTPLDVGTLEITATVEETDNYKAGTVTATFTVLPAPMKLKLTSNTTVYGDDLTLQAEGNDGSPVTFTLADGSGEFAEIAGGVLKPKKVGTVTVKMSAPATAHYQAAVDVEGTVEITPREVEVIWSNLEFDYQKKAWVPSAEVKADDLVNGDSCTVDTITVKGFAEAINAGSYTAVASGLSNSNYVPKASSLEMGFVIKPAKATISWETGVTYTYNGAQQAPKAQVTNLYEGDECDVIVLGTKNAATGITAMATGLSNANYTLDGVENLTTTYDILPFQITVSWSNTSLIYTGKEQAPTATAVGLFAGDSCEIIVTGGQTNVGEYTATAIGVKNGNYKLKDDTDHSTQFSIIRGEIGVTLVDGNAIYGTPYQLEVQGAPQYSTITYTLGEGAENVILSGDRLIPMNIGTVTVTVTVAATENFEETSDTKVITILPRPIEVTWNNLTFEYDKNSHIPTATISNLVNSDSCIVTVEGAQTNVGDHTASVAAISNNKYALIGGTNVTQPFSITPRVVTVEWGETELTYNGLEQHPEITIGNLLDGDVCYATVEGVKDAGINLTATLTGITNGNYTMEPVDNKTVLFNINRLEVILEWSDLDLIYNGEEQGPSARVTNLCAGDECTVTVAGREVEVGTYAASAIALSNPNYSLPEEVEVPFTIGKAERSFSLVNTNTVYGTELSLNIVGVEEGTVPTYKVTAGTGNATVAEDVLTPTAAGLVYLTVTIPETDNYKASTKTFDITIEKYAVEIEWDIPEFIYDGTEHKPVASVSNALEGETCEVLSVSGAIHAGNAQVATVTAISNPNYTLDGGKDVSTTFTISPMPVTIEWDENRTYTYNGNPQGPEAHVTDLVAGDNCSITVSGKETNAGTYTASIVSLSNPDYTLDGAIGLTANYTIERAQPVITIKTTNATLGIDQLIEIEGNLGGGVVSFEIDEGGDLAYISGNMLVSQKVGRVKVHAYVGETINTLSAEAEGYIEIAKGKAPLVMDRTNVTYGNTLPLAVDDNDGFLRDEKGNLIFGDVTFTVAPGEEDRAVIEGNVLRPLKAGTVHVIMSTEESDNFYATSVTVEITVNKRVVILEWSTETFTYNKTEQKPTATVTNLVGDDIVTVNVKGAINAGKNLTASAVSLSDEENYTLVNAQNTTKTFDIDPLPVDVIWGGLTLEFNGKHQYPEASVTTIDGESCTVNLEGGGTTVGKYEVTAVSLSNSNYVLTDNNRTVEMEITPAELKPVLSPVTAVYKQEVTLSISGNLENGAVTYTVLTDESEGDAVITGDKFMPTKSGNVVIRINVEATENCYAYEGTATIFVDKAERGEITLVNADTVYGETLDLAILGNEEEPGSVTYAVANVTGEGDEPSDPRAEIGEGNILITRHAGQVFVTVTIGETDNYKQAVVTLTVTIAPRVAEITWTNTEFDYNGKVQTPTAAVSNLINGDECEVTVTGGMINAGSYFASVESLSNPDYTYSGSLTAHTPFTIGKVEITIELVNTHITINKIESLSITGNKGEAAVTFSVANGTGTAVITDQGGEASAEGQFIKGTKLGTVIVTAYVPATTNFLAAEVKALVIIEKDRPTITLKNDTVMYGDTLTLEIEGNVENGRVTYSVSNATGSAAYSDGVLRPLRVGVVNVTVTVGETENYGMSSTTHEVTITPRPITGLEWDEDTLEFTYDGITIFAPEAKALGTLNNEECGVVVAGGQIKAGTYNTAYAVSLTNPNYSLDGVDVRAPEFVINKVKPNIKILTTAITIGVPTVIEISGNNDNAEVTYLLENGTGIATIEGGVITGTQLGEVYLTVSVPETDNYLFGSASAVILVEKPATPVELETVVTVYGTDLTLNVLNNLENGAVSLALKEDTTLASLKGNVLTPKGVGEVVVVVTVAETDTYKETVKEITVTILPKPVEITWEYPEFVYDGTEHKPIAKVSNLVGDDECEVTVSGAVNAGTDCAAQAVELGNKNYTLEGGTGVNTTFVIKPRPVVLSWEYSEFTYNGEVQTPTPKVDNALDGDAVTVTEVSGSKDAGDDLIATAEKIDNPNYTVDGGENITTTYSIKPYEIDVEWGELRIPYNGKVNVPEAYAVGTFFDEVVFAQVEGDGIHVRQDPYIATITGMVGPNYVIKQATLDDPNKVTTEYYIIPATVTFDEAELVKEYSGEFQQPEFKIHLFAEDDDLYIEVTGGGIAVGKYTVELELFGASTNDYELSEEDKSKLFEIVKKSLTLKVSSLDMKEKYTGEAVDISGWANWYTLALEGLLDADADKSIADLFTGNTLKFVPEIYAELDGEALAEVIEKGSYYILPVLQSGELSGAENYAISDIVYESGALTVGGKLYLELTEESKYQFVFEEAGEYNFKYLRAYAEKGMVHGVDDVNFETYVMGQIPLETTLTEFLANFADTTALKIYTNKDKLIFANGQLTEEYESIMNDGTIFVGTGWHVEYGDGDERDIVYLSVLGDLDGNGLLNVLDTSIISSYIQGSRSLDLICRLSAELTNKGAISTSDLSAMSVVLTNGSDTIKNYYTYKTPVNSEQP